MSRTEQNTEIAAQLRAARLQQGLEIGALARELKNPSGVLEAIERGDWSRLGAPVFARHLVGAYAARLGVAVDLDAVAGSLVAPELRSQVPASRIGRFADFSARHVAYVGGMLLVVPLVYTLLDMTATGPTQVRALDPVLPAMIAADPAAATAQETLPAPPVPAATAAPSTVIASLAGAVAEDAVAADVAQFELRFHGESWIEIVGRDGATIERVLAQAGDVRRFAAAEVGRVTIGNADATEVLLDGSGVNLDAVRFANVARFALSSDGSIEAVAR